MYFNKALIHPQLDVQNQKDLLKIMADDLLGNECVKDSFLNAVLTRESEYPTGLEVKNIGFAIPHTDSKHVLESQICLATLKDNILFSDMTDINNEIPVKIVFMLAMKDPGDQITTLQKLMELFSNKNFANKILELDDKKEILEELEKNGIY